MSCYHNPESHPVLLGAKFDTETQGLVEMKFQGNTFQVGDSITYDYRTGVEFYITHIVEGNGAQVTLSQIRTMEGTGYNNIELRWFLPGTRFMKISTMVGEYDSM